MNCKKYILIIEDDDSHFKLMKYSFDKINTNCNIIRLKDGQEALDYFQNINNEINISFIILDINIPKIDGLTVLENIKNSKFKNIPVVILTTSQSYIDVKEAYDKKANSYIVKPIDFNKFQKIIRIIYHYWYTRNETINGH